MLRIKGFFFILTFIFLMSGCLAFRNSMFYCGFSGDYCGQSTTNDVHPSITTVILAFANTYQDGRIVVDETNFPGGLVQEWKRNGK